MSAAFRGVEFLETRRLLAAQVYVNDDWAIMTDVGPPGISGGDTVESQGTDSNVGAHVIGVDAFTTIGDGVAGPNSVVITPNGPDGGDDSAFNNNAQQGLLVSSSNVTISDLTIDGGVNSDFRQGIITDFRNNTVYNNITISDVHVQNVLRRGIEIYSSDAVAAPKSTGILIDSNHISNVGLYEGVLVFDADATISNNVIGNCAIGIASNTLHGAANAPLLQVLGNYINGDPSRATIGMNLAGLADTSYIGDVNVINQAGGPAEPDTGLIVQFPYGQVTVATNRFFESNADSAIFLYAASNPAKPVIEPLSLMMVAMAL